MTDNLRIFWRGFLIVTLTASNVWSVSHDHVSSAFIGGFLISFVWWGNAHKSAHTTAKHAALFYGAGAACGTVTGMLGTPLLYRLLG